MNIKNECLQLDINRIIVVILIMWTMAICYNLKCKKQKQKNATQKNMSLF